MPRSATDATRFTSTTPHVSAKPAPNHASPQRTPGPPGETPQQRVKRLRGAANAAREAQVSTFDKVIVKGRVWADRAHRFTALSLIGITVLCGGVTVYALGDMMIYNRKKRSQFYQEQKALHESAIHTAKLALETGSATEAQIEFLNRENEEAARVERVKKEKAGNKGILAKGKDWLFSGLKKEEEGDEVGTSARRLGYEALSEEDDAMGVRESDILRAIEDKKEEVKEKVKQAFAEEKERQRSGGPLDRIGTAVTDNSTPGDQPQKSGGWTSFMTRR